MKRPTKRTIISTFLCSDDVAAARQERQELRRQSRQDEGASGCQHDDEWCACPRIDMAEPFCHEAEDDGQHEDVQQIHAEAQSREWNDEATVDSAVGGQLACHEEVG